MEFGRIVVKPIEKFDWAVCAAHVERRFTELAGHYIRFEALDK